VDTTVVEADIDYPTDADLLEHAVRRQDDGAFDAPGHYIGVGRLAVGASELAAEVPSLDVGAAGQRLEVQRLGVVSVDPVADAAQPRQVAQPLRVCWSPAWFPSSVVGSSSRVPILVARGRRGDQLGDHREQLQPPVEAQRLAPLGRRVPGQRLRTLDPDTDQHVSRSSPSGLPLARAAFTGGAPLFARVPKDLPGQRSQAIGRRGSGV
jgi:hypothetical protein